MTTKQTSIRFWSIITGVSLLIMAIAAGYAFGFSFSEIHVEDNNLQTLDNIKSNPALFYSGAIIWLVILITDLIVTVGLYKYLSNFSKLYAIGSGLTRLVYSLILGYAILTLFNKNTQSFLSIWSFGLLIFGFHLIITGIGTLKRSEVPILLSILIIISGLSYILVNGIENFIPSAIALANSLESILTLPMALGELAFAIWLLVKGGKTYSTSFK